MSLTSKDAQKVKNFAITTYKKGFTASSIIDEVLNQEYFHFREIHKIIHYLGRYVEVVNYNGSRRVFYNDLPSESQKIYDSFNNKMIDWMKSNLN